MTATSDKTTSLKPTRYTLGEWTFCPDRKQLLDTSGTEHLLEDKVSDLLVLLCARRGEIVSREEILASVWAGRTLSEQTVPVAISKIRKALGEGGTDSKLLQTVPKRGYRLAPVESEAVANAIPAQTIVPDTTSHRPARLIPLGLMAALLFVAAIFWPQNAPLVPAAGADKPGIILTVKDIRTTLESEKDTGKVIALSELASFYLSQIPEVLVIRHWWNVDAPDPTGGIFTRYGPDTPVYLLTGSLIEDAGTQMVSLFLSDPKTDAVIWSGMHPVTDGSKGYFDTLARMFETIGVLKTPQANNSLATVPSEDARYWTARYLAHLSHEGSASGAAQLLGDILTENPSDTAALETATALAARWQSISAPNHTRTTTENRADHFAFVDQAAVNFYRDNNAEAALNLIEKALTIAPGDHYALSLKAEILIADGKTEAALETYRKALRLAPFASAYEERIAELSTGSAP